MRILIASSEVFPYSKTGGLADMVGALGKTLARQGHQVGMVTPLYRGIREKFPALSLLDWKLDLQMAGARLSGQIYTLRPAPNLTIYFVDQPQLYHRSDLYQMNGLDFVDNAERFIFFSKAVVNLARYLPWKPQVVHLHDWQAAPAALLLHREQNSRMSMSTRHEPSVSASASSSASESGSFSSPSSVHALNARQSVAEAPARQSSPGVCLTIHNLAYQGVFPSAKYGLLNLPWDYFTHSGVEFYGQLNCLKAGIVYSDRLTTVSPRYAREITTQQLGCGLDGLLRQREQCLSGILNGVDYDEWKTVGNPSLKHAYSRDQLEGKEANKRDLQQEFGLPVDASIPLFASIGRLVEQKGVDLIPGALEGLLNEGLQFILVGTGSPPLQDAFQDLACRFPAQVAVRIAFDQALSHRVEAGCDFFLMPSRYEPCGLNQMYSLRYGGIPIVRKTGGLDDAVTDITESVDRADGIKFGEPSVPALTKAIRKALALYQEKELLRHYRRNGMAVEFSWDSTAAKFVKVYEECLVTSQASALSGQALAAEAAGHI